MPSLPMPEPVEHLLAVQDQVARLDQLVVAGMIRAEIARQIAWGRWQRSGPTVVVAHNGPLTPLQQQWASVLGAGRRSALCGRSAATHHGLDGWDDGRITCWSNEAPRPRSYPCPWSSMSPADTSRGSIRIRYACRR